MKAKIETVYFLNNQTNDIISEPKYFPNGANVSIGVHGLLDTAYINYMVSYDNDIYYYYIDNDIIYKQTKEGKEIEIIETIPFYIKIELANSSVDTDVSVTGYYIDKFINYGIIQQ